MSDADATIAKLQKQVRVLQKKLERSQWHRVDLENQHDRDQHLYRRLQSDLEAATREAQIEAALERIRAQSLRMEHSTELVATSAVFHEQLLALGVDTEFSYVWLPDEAAGRHQFWATWTEDDGGAPAYRSHAVTYALDREEPYTAACLAAWESDEPLFVDFVPPADVEGFFAAWPEVFERAPHMRPDHFPDGLYYAEAYVEHGCFGIDIRREPTDEERDIIRRVAVEFERAYTRYLDLERAEAQAREAEIEAALEKVRSRSLAVTSTDEFGEVVTVVFEKLSELGIPAYSVTMPLLRDDTDAWDVYGCGVSDEGLTTLNFKLPYFSNPITDDILAAKSTSANGYLSTVYAPEDKDTYYDYALTQTELRNLPDDVKETIRRRDPYAVCVAYARRSMIIANDFEGNELGEAQAEVLQRFSRVLEQAYTRFLDLQRAEEQAREAEVELALERVRARTMAMQESAEISDVALVLYQQLQHLGGELWGTGFAFCVPDSDTDEFWFVNQGGVLPTVTIPHTDDAVHRQMYEGWQQRRTLYTAEAGGADLEAHYAYMLTVPDVREFFQGMLDAGLSFPAWQQWHAAYFSHGYLLVITTEPFEEVRILPRFAKAFEQAYVRFFDLERAEAQAREAEIEAALERVRSRTMAMQSSGELPEAANLLFEQVRSLGMPAWSAGYCIWDDDKQGITAWMSSEGVLQPPFHAPLTEDAYFMGMREGYDRGVPLHVHDKGGEALAEHYAYMRTLPVVGEILDSIIEAGHPLPTYQINHCAYFSHGFLLFITYEPAPEAHPIFERFAGVFDQTYTRYLDLQQAEAQAREAQVEAALERVRSRSMAMQSSDELGELSYELVKQVQALGVDTWHCAFHIYDEGQESSTEWGANADGFYPTYTIPRVGVFERYHAIGQSGTTLHVEEIGPDRCAAHYRALCAVPGVGDVLLGLRASGVPFPESQVDHVAFFRYGYLIFVTFEPAPEAHDIFRRFATVFEQTYTRFLDLKQAEEQAREAQIEASLERVRSRAMAMRTSGELREMVLVILNEMKVLAFASGRCTIILFDRETGDSEFWMSGLTDADLPERYHVPYHKLPTYRALHEGWRRGTPFFEIELAGEVKREQDRFFHEETEFRRLPEPAKEGMRRFGDIWLSNAATTHGVVQAVGAEPLADDNAAILRRFAKVIDLTYTRVEDIQQTEAQVREAQIETAIERVRSRALAMTTSGELLDVIFKIRGEFASLGLDCGAFWHTRYTPEVYQKALTSLDGKKLAAVMELPRDFASNPALAAWEHGSEPVGVFPFDAEAGAEYMHHMATRGKFAEIDPEAITVDMVREHGGITFVQARTAHGEIGYSLWGQAEPTAEARSVLVRFATAFDLAYRRFEDLQKAEADHRALLEEKALTEQALDELRATQAQLIQAEKMASLGALTAGIAHEIKNPLNFVTNFASLSQELVQELADEPDPEERATLLADLASNAAKIEEHGRRADGIVRSMMAHARSGSGERRAVALNALVEEYVSHAEHAMRVRHPDFRPALALDLADGVGDVEAVPQEIGRVLVNLVDNALDATRQRAAAEGNGYVPTVTVSTAQEDGRAVVRVEDNGPGMAEAVRARVFEPFFTTKPTGEGTGLGLSLSHDIVAQGHGGTLAVESAEGQGAVFVVTLPAGGGF